MQELQFVERRSLRACAAEWHLGENWRPAQKKRPREAAPVWIRIIRAGRSTSGFTA